MSADALGAIRAYLEAQLASSASVYVGELPARSPADPKHPPKAVVLRAVGGNPYDVILEVVQQRLDVTCIGPTMAEADDLRREVFDVLRAVSVVTQGSVVLHHCTPAGGCTLTRDPDTEWPMSVEPWVLQSAQRAAA